MVDEEGIAVLFSLCETRRACCAACTGDVLDDHLLLEGTGHGLADKPCDGIGGSSSHKGHDQGDAAVRIVLCHRCSQGEYGDNSSHDCGLQRMSHRASSVLGYCLRISCSLDVIAGRNITDHRPMSDGSR